MFPRGQKRELRTPRRPLLVHSLKQNIPHPSFTDTDRHQKHTSAQVSTRPNKNVPNILNNPHSRLHTFNRNPLVPPPPPPTPALQWNAGKTKGPTKFPSMQFAVSKPSRWSKTSSEVPRETSSKMKTGVRLGTTFLNVGIELGCHLAVGARATGVRWGEGRWSGFLSVGLLDFKKWRRHDCSEGQEGRWKLERYLEVCFLSCGIDFCLLVGCFACWSLEKEWHEL